MIHTTYKSELTNKDILPHKHVLYWRSKVKNGDLPLINVEPSTFLWLWWKSLFNKIYFMTCSNLDDSEYTYDFFKIPKTK